MQWKPLLGGSSSEAAKVGRQWGNNKAKVSAMGTELFEMVDQEWKIIVSIDWGNSFECSKLVELSGVIENVPYAVRTFTAR